MPHALTKTVYYFDEITDKAKEKARDWFKQGALDDDWWNFVYEDADEIAKIIGIEIDSKSVKLMGGSSRQSPCIWFAGFSSQGDGACFEGRYSYAKGAVKAIRAHATTDTELHKIADAMQELQSKHCYGLEARVKHRGHYYHSRCTDIDVTEARTGNDAPEQAQEELAELLRNFMDWIYSQLEKEHDYQLSDEVVDESIRANEYEFSESGHRST